MCAEMLPFEDMRGSAWGALLVRCALGMGAGGCAAETAAAGPEVSLRVEAVVYGGDDRQDYFAHPDAATRELAASSGVALIDRRLLQAMPDGEVRYPTETFGELYDLCEGERFTEQPSLAHCSGTLVEDDLVLTSAHCLDVVPCEELQLVFGFLYREEGELARLMRDNVYGCSTVEAEQRRDPSGREVDHAWIRLDRPVSGARRPARIHVGDEPLARGEPLTVIGFSAGLPLKIDSGAEVVDARGSTLDFFRADSDTFHGSSGSGVFDREGRLRGVLARGADDYIQVHADCTSVRSDENDVIEQREEATYVARAIDALCDGDGAVRELCAAHAAADAIGPIARVTACTGVPGIPSGSGTAAAAGVLLTLAMLRRRRAA